MSPQQPFLPLPLPNAPLVTTTTFTPTSVKNDVHESCRLFIGNLPSSITTNDLIQLLSEFGGVTLDVHILSKSNPAGGKGAIVQLSGKEAVSYTIAALHGKVTLSGSQEPLVVRYADSEKYENIRKKFIF